MIKSDNKDIFIISIIILIALLSGCTTPGEVINDMHDKRVTIGCKVTELSGSGSLVNASGSAEGVMCSDTLPQCYYMKYSGRGIEASIGTPCSKPSE